MLWYDQCLTANFSLPTAARQKQNARGAWLPARIVLNPACRLSHQLFDLGRLALLFMTGIRVSAVNALLAKTGAAPDQVVDRSLNLLDALGHIA